MPFLAPKWGLQFELSNEFFPASVNICFRNNISSLFLGKHARLSPNVFKTACAHRRQCGWVSTLCPYWHGKRMIGKGWLLDYYLSMLEEGFWRRWRFWIRDALQCTPIRTCWESCSPVRGVVRCSGWLVKSKKNLLFFIALIIITCTIIHFFWLFFHHTSSSA